MTKASSWNGYQQLPCDRRSWKYFAQGKIYRPLHWQLVTFRCLIFRYDDIYRCSRTIDKSWWNVDESFDHRLGYLITGQWTPTLRMHSIKGIYNMIQSWSRLKANTIFGRNAYLDLLALLLPECKSSLSINRSCIPPLCWVLILPRVVGIDN